MDDSDQSGDPVEPRRSIGVSRCAPDADHPSIEIDDPEQTLTDAQLAWVREHGARALRELSARLPARGEVRVLIVGDERMARVHEERAGVAGTTDVLTFDLAPGDDALLDADLYVCADEAARRAKSMGHAPEREVVLYILHGALHCLGHDDHDDDAYARMHALEDEILGAIGVGATFEPSAGPDRPTDAGATR